jgi:hypothetical protein
MTKQVNEVLLVLSIISFIGILAFCEEKKNIGFYPYTETIEIATDYCDVIFLTTIIFNDEEEVTMLYSEKSNIVYSGRYIDVEDIISFSKTHPPSEDELLDMKQYYQDIIEKIIW